MKLNNKWAVLGWLAAGQLFGKCKRSAFETFQIYSATAYLKGVHIVREFFLHQIGVLACVLFLLGGLMIMEGAAVFVFFQTPGARAAAVFAVGAFNFAAGLGLLRYLASSKRWLEKAAKYNDYLGNLLEEERLGYRRNGRPRERKVRPREFNENLF